MLGNIYTHLFAKMSLTMAVQLGNHLVQNLPLVLDVAVLGVALVVELVMLLKNLHQSGFLLTDEVIARQVLHACGTCGALCIGLPT